MQRLLFVLIMAVGSLGLGTGCAHFVEARAIEKFTRAVETDDLDRLKSSTSSAFRRVALRRPKAVHDLKILDLPSGETTVLNVQDVSETEKRVTAAVGPTQREVTYILVRDPDSNKWVVDDVAMQQNRDDVTVTRTLTEQMALLMNVRDFLSAWAEGTRQEVLAAVAPELRVPLQGLPPAYLADLTRQVLGEAAGDPAGGQNAEINGDTAVVRIPRGTGRLVLSMDRLDGTWLVSDVTVESRRNEDSMASLRKQAEALQSVTQFLEAYNAEDRSALEKVCSRGLYRGSLAFADLSLVSLPTAGVPPEGYEVSVQEHGADVVLPGETEIVKINLTRAGDDTAEPPEGAYRVDDVTLYELEGDQEKRLSAVFTGHSVLQLFWESLQDGDVPMLRKVSTADFTNRIWRRLDGASLRRMPLAGLDAGPPRILSTEFQGAVTKIEADHEGTSATYILRERQGEVQVDDVHLSGKEKPRSLKKRLELMIPLHRFMAAVREHRIDGLQQVSSRDFSQLIWDRLDRIPAMVFVALDHLNQSPTAIHRNDGEAVIELGTEDQGARVWLVREQGRWLVDDILLVAGPDAEQQAKLKETIRRRMAEGELSRPSSPPADAVSTQAAQPAARGEDESLPRLSDEAFTPPVPGRRN